MLAFYLKKLVFFDTPLYNNPGVLVPPKDGKYDTGDIVSLDAEGYISILGREKRFAKIAGEMISLAFVEEFIAKIWPHHIHAVISVPDDKKGEALILVTDKNDADQKEIRAYAKVNGIGALLLPKKIKTVKQVPVFKTGKIDYLKVREVVI